MSDRPLSRAQARMLESIRDTGNPERHLRGRSEFGGAASTLPSLFRRKYVFSKTTRGRSRWYLTTSGRVALADYLRSIVERKLAR